MTTSRWLLLALVIGCTEARPNPTPPPQAQAAFPPSTPAVLPEASARPEPPPDEVLLYDAGWRGRHHAALVKSLDGIWRRACDRVDAVPDPHHGDILLGTLTRRTERGEYDVERTVCTVDVRDRTTLAARGHTLFAPPALGPFTSGMSTLEVAKIVGLPSVPERTDAATHVRFGPYEIQMKRGVLYFVSALRSELGALVVPGLPLVAAGAEVSLQAMLPPDRRLRAEPIGAAHTFKPSLPDATARSYAKLLWTTDTEGGFADLRPIVDEVLLFTAMGRHPEARAHLRSALISLHQRGLLQ